MRGGGSGERSVARRWLCHSLSAGDAARILDPILCLLLHPHTRRVSVQHVTVRQLHGAQVRVYSASDSVRHVTVCVTIHVYSLFYFSKH